MDFNTTAIVTSSSTLSVPSNTTETFVIEEGEVDAVSIIVWCLGGVLLVSLLALLGRIILARDKFPEHLEYLERNAYHNNLFRIPVSSSQCHSRVTNGTLSRDTTELVSRSGTNITDSPVAHQPRPGNSAQRSIPRPCNESSSTNSRDVQNSNQRQTLVPIRNAPPPQIVTADAQGRIATVNGYVIRPPSYEDVVSPSNGIPSVIVARSIYIPRFSL